MNNEPKQGDYNYFTSVCDTCYQKGWHTKPEKCVRKYSKTCECCHQTVNGMQQCTGTNIMRDYSNIATQFASYYGKDIRIKVGFCDKKGKVYEIKTGTVSMTTGWKPSFMLMLRKNSRGSSHLLSKEDKIL